MSVHTIVCVYVCVCVQERQRYLALGENCERLQSQIKSLKSTGITAKIRLSRVRFR